MRDPSCRSPALTAICGLGACRGGCSRSRCAMVKPLAAKFKIGQVVRHRLYPFRGVIFDVDPIFNNTEEWWLSIPAEVRPGKDQPFYHLFAENAEDRKSTRLNSSHI